MEHCIQLYLYLLMKYVTGSQVVDNYTDYGHLIMNNESLVTTDHTLIDNHWSTGDYNNSYNQTDGVETVIMMSEETYNKHSSAIGHCLIPFSALGLLANTFIIVVFGERKLRNPTDIYLTAISSLQILSILINMVNVIHQYIEGETQQKKSQFYYVYNLYVFNYLGVCILRTIYCLVMLLSAERLVAMVFPFKSQYFRIVKNPVICIIVTFTLTVLFRTPSLLQYIVISYTEEDGNLAYGVKKTDYDPKILENCRLASKITFTYIPLSGILFCNIALCCVLHRIRRRRRRLQETVDANTSREHQTTLAILVSSCLFFCFNLPTVTNAIVGIIRSDYNYFSENRYVFSFVQELGDLLNLVSFCLDFFAYLTINAKFRERFFSRICFCRFSVRGLSHDNGIELNTSRSGTRCTLTESTESVRIKSQTSD